jgi:FdhD protein
MIAAPPTCVIDVLHVSGNGSEPRVDTAAAEEPLEIRLGGTSFIVTMRTPGADHELAAGFLLAERIIQQASDVHSIRHCADTPDRGNVLDVLLTGEAATKATAMLAERRFVMATSACGVCGRRTIDDLLQAVPRVHSDLRVSPSLISSLPDRLRSVQAVFAETGGLHAAALYDAQGEMRTMAEDVGRHNAVDKVIGVELLAGRLPLADAVLLVSGRTSFEIVQKAVMAGVPILASVSAPSSLAVELARDAGVTLVGFVRGDTFNVYSRPDRLGF